jgi:uracil-DNA glycosylase family 4
LKVVLGSGPVPCDIAFIGEAPGRIEAQTGIPFSGPSGKLQASLLHSYGLDIRNFYRTNICKEFREGNPDPTPRQISDWTPTLLAELEEVRPRLIVCVGRFAAQWFLGESTPSLQVIHGIPHRPAKSLRHILPESCLDSIILPVFHPSAALRARDRDKLDIRSYVRWDYEQVADTYHRLKSGLPIHFRHDPYAGSEEYLDVTGRELAREIDSEHWWRIEMLGLDTEGRPGNWFSVQVSTAPGSGRMLRTSQPDFMEGIQALAAFLHKRRPVVAMHQASTPVCACYDVVACREMSGGVLELQGLPWFDTMYNAYLYRLESQSLKALSERWQGMEMSDYESLIGDIGRDKQISWLQQARDLALNWPKPSKRHIKQNDGTVSITQPQHIRQSITGILRDIESGKQTKDGDVDPFKRWTKQLRKSNPEQVHTIERELGIMPEGSLDDIPLEQATFYAGRDPDSTLRLAQTFISRNDARLSSLMSEGMLNLPIVERLQSRGMPVSRSYFISLKSEMQSELDELGRRISSTYWEGEPFNPKSPPQVASLCRRLGLKPLKRTKTGAASTGKKSIEEYRYTHEAIALVFDWRERQHNRDMYCNDVLSRIPDDWPEDLYTIRANFRPTKIPTRRLATSNPNILGIPVRTPIGRKIRHGYIGPSGMIFAAYDLSGIEMRCMAHESRDPLLCKVFYDGIHPHRFTAANIFQLDSLSAVTDTQKAVGKTINFLTIYGGGYKKFYEELRSQGITAFTVHDCKRMMIEYFRTYSGIEAYRQAVIAEAKRLEYVDDYSGMRRYLPGINCGDSEIEAEEGRAAVSQKIQGLAQTMIRNSMIWLDGQLRTLTRGGVLDPDCWRLQVHDELVFLVNEGEEEVLHDLVLHALTRHAGIKLIVPVEAEAHYGKTWGELK